MEDFNEYAKTADSRKKTDAQGAGNLFDTVRKLAQRFDGKSTNDLIRAIYAEAEKGKRAGTLTNADIDNFAAFLSPALDEKKRRYLKKIAEDLKKI